MWSRWREIPWNCWKSMRHWPQSSQRSVATSGGSRRSNRRRSVTHFKPAQVVSGIPHQLAQLYRVLRKHFGYAHPWWPGEPLEIALTAILVQQCDWSAAWKAVTRLREHELLSLPALAGAKAAVVQSCIHGVAFGPTKAKRLIGFASAVVAGGHTQIERFLSPVRNTAGLRGELLTFPGIGPETADSILLFASDHPCFVIDAYTRRVMR